jgi:CNT family concentrative nucleoside transporter
MIQLRSLVGFVLLAGLAWLFSEDRRRVNWRTVAAGMGLQLALGVALVLNPAAATVFEVLNRGVLVLSDATTAGTSFVFGYLGTPQPPFAAAGPGSYFVLAFQALPLILVVSALTSLLFYWRVLPLVVRGFSWVLRRALGVTGCEGLAAAANVFVGMVEAPLFIRPYLGRLTRGELFCVMSCGMATIAGTVMVLYARFLEPVLGASALGHVLIASIISAPAAIVTARILVPESNSEMVSRVDEMAIRSEARGSLDAIVRGTTEGVQIAINVCAMLIVAVALIYLADACLGILPEVAEKPLSFQRVLGWCLAPLVWLMGVPWGEAAAAGGLMGLKTMANELLAYLALPAAGLSERTNLMMTYALCGFANFGSLGIMIGGMGTLAPERRAEIVQLGPKSILAGTLATMMTGAVVGMLV